MTDQPPRSADDPPPTEFQWDSPRWREADPPPDDAERGRRFRDDRAPRQRGAIDAGGSVPTSREEQDRSTDVTET